MKNKCPNCGSDKVKFSYEDNIQRFECLKCGYTASGATQDVDLGNSTPEQPTNKCDCKCHTPVLKEKCFCEGEYPQLKNHTPDRCYTGDWPKVVPQTSSGERCKCDCHLQELSWCNFCKEKHSLPSPSSESWVEQWEKKIKTYDKDGGFIVYVEDYDNNDFDPDLMVSFIKNTITAEVESAESRRDKNIGMLRQWLNEDRIDDPKKMVTNKDIKYWFNQKMI